MTLVPPIYNAKTRGSLEHRVININDKQYADFIDMLDAPVSDNHTMSKLLARKHGEDTVS
ncbi:DUF1778 domain-containing protein [Salmonella enterica subsp. enterica serovar Oslo]|nr:DUF1778 domain-containing protein [Salmonella enterica subsp. enterica serovar Oslo]